ncbi:MAG: tetratricopeptide repeat protein [Terriglobia bacterium]
MARTTSPLRAGILCGIALLLTALVFPPPAFPQSAVTIGGQVRTLNGQPITSGVSVNLATSQGDQVASRPVDSGGGFEFDAVPKGMYELTVTADNFQTYHQTIDESFGAPSYYRADVMMTPTAHRKIPAAALPALTDEAAPKNARKEFSQGDQALKKRDLEKARLHLEKAVQEYPCYARAHAALAEIHVAGHRPDSAEASLKRAIQCDGNFLDSYDLLAQLYITENKFADSESVLHQGLRLSPGAWTLLYQMGRTHIGMEKYQEALRDFEEAESFHPDVPAIFHAQFANAYMAAGEYDKALAELDTYLRLDPNGRFASSAREASQTLRSRGATPASAQTGPPPAIKPQN